MIAHKKNSHRPNRECPICSAKVINLKRHMETHSNHPEKPARKIQQINKVSCEICGKEYRMDCIKKHFDRVHMKLKRYFCDYCGKSFYGKLGLESHIKVDWIYENLIPKTIVSFSPCRFMNWRKLWNVRKRTVIWNFTIKWLWWDTFVWAMKDDIRRLVKYAAKLVFLMIVTKIQ